MTHINYKNYKKTAIAIAIGLTTLTGAANAAELEVITVTSLKRVQTLADVPLSMQVVSGDNLEKQNIIDLKGVVEKLPNVMLATAPGPSSVSIRGIGTGVSNTAAEQSVGIYIDGIYVSRGYQFNSPFTDVERVEVLKGPQGVLQGKNSVAGAIVITSRRPTEDFEASIKGAYEFENEGYTVEAMTSGALSDNVFGRVVLQKNLTGGWLDTNTRFAADGTTVLHGKENQNEDELSNFRASLVWEPSDTLSIFVKAESGEQESSGVHFGPSAIQPGATYAGVVPLIDFFKNADPNFDFIGNGVISNGFPIKVNSDLAVTNPFTGEQTLGVFDITNEDIRIKVDSASLSTQVDWTLQGGTLTSISGYSEFEHEEVLAYSMSPTDWFYYDRKKGNGGEEFDQFTQEIRFVSIGDETIDYIVGAFYMDRNIKMDKQRGGTNFSTSGLSGPIFFDSIYERIFEENTSSLSAFAQLTWNISDTFSINAGARYTDETKELNVDWSGDYLFYLPPGIIPDIPGGSATVLGLFGVEYYDTASLKASGERTKIEESGIDPSISIQWDVNKNLMVYASATKATKAGGFNSSANSPDNLSFDSEEATGYETGFKGSFFKSSLFFNFALYQSSFDNLQVSALDSASNTLFFKNAAEATTQGFEADLRYAITDSVEIGGAMAYTDATYDNFPGASCSTGSSREADCIGTTRNAKGDKLTYAPEWSGNIYANYYHELDNSMLFTLRGELMYSDEFYYNGQNDPYMQQDAYTKLDISASLTSADENWKVSIIGKNLTDETTSSFGGATLFFEGAYWSNVEAPRQIFLTAEYNWF